MKKTFSLLVFFMCLFSKGTLAEEIKYGRFVTYDGKIDVSKNPEGKGKLITEYKVERMTVNGRSDEVNKDILQGKSSQGKVVDAKVQFARYNGPLWVNRATFKGELDYEILDNNSVKYTLLEGTFTSSDYCDYTISRDNPLVITRIPSFEGCETKSEPLCYKTKGGNIQSSIYSGFYQSIGEIKEVYQVEEYVLNNQWELRKGEITPEPVYADGTKVTIYGQYDFDIEYANGDFLRQKGEELVLRKTFPDGVLDYNIVKKEASIAYADGANYKGTVDVQVLFRNFVKRLIFRGRTLLYVTFQVVLRSRNGDRYGGFVFFHGRIYFTESRIVRGNRRCGNRTRVNCGVAVIFFVAAAAENGKRAYRCHHQKHTFNNFFHHLFSLYLCTLTHKFLLR